MKEEIYKVLELIKKIEGRHPDFEKIKEYTTKVLRDWKDISCFLYYLPEIDCDIYALEAALLAVEGEVDRGIKGNGLAKAILFHLYHDGEYEILIHDRTVKIQAPELNSRDRYDAFLTSDCPYHFMHVGDEDIVPTVYTLDAHDYMMLYLFGTNFGYDATEYPVEAIEDMSQKSFERAIGYLPLFVDHLVNATKIPDCGMERILCKMEEMGYSTDEISRFCQSWIDTVEEKGLSCLGLMDIYISGKYEYARRGQTREVTFDHKKDYIRSISHIPTHVSWLVAMHTSPYVDNKDIYDPDLALENRIRQMRYNVFGKEEITEFATLWIGEMMKHDRTFYSLMYLRLFGENFGGTCVELDGIKNFEAALALVPDYLEYIFSYEGFDDEYCGKFDSDSELYKLIKKMNGNGYGEDEVNIFVLRWTDAALKSKKPFNSKMYTLLMNQFVFKHESFKITLIENRKNFNEALSSVASWVEYLTDMSVQYHNGYGERDIFDLLIAMREVGYENGQMKKLLRKFLEELARLNTSMVSHVKCDLDIYAEKEPWLKDFLPLFEPFKQ